jgi:hypothetical protein
MDTFAVGTCTVLGLRGKWLTRRLGLSAGFAEFGLRGGVKLDTLNKAFLYSIKYRRLGYMAQGTM